MKTAIPIPTSLLNRIQPPAKGVIDSLLSAIPREVLLNPETKVADLAMGGGHLLHAVYAMRLESGLDPVTASKTLFGFESNPVFVKYAAWKVGLPESCVATLKVEDFDNLDMQFDVIIGNPPFQEVTSEGRKDQASNLWTKFWVKSLNLTKDNGFVSLITPTSWLSPSANLKGDCKFNSKNRLWDVFDSYTSSAQVSGVGEYFKGVGSSFGVVTVNKAGSQGLSFVEGHSTELGFLPKSGLDTVVANIGGPSTLGDIFKISQDCGTGLRVSVPLTRKVSADSVEVLTDGDTPQSGSSNHKLYLYINVFNREQADQVKMVLVSNAEILNNHCRWSGFMNIRVCKMLNYQL